MTGPEHYRKAEEILSILDEERDPASWEAAIRSGEIARAIDAAQAHATLALAAATALGREGADRMLPSKDRDAWFAAAAECKKGEAA